jgi:hypothetical protein
VPVPFPHDDVGERYGVRLMVEGFH